MTAAETVFVVIDTGCHDCGVGGVPGGIYRNLNDAHAAAERYEADINKCYDGRQTIVRVHKMTLPAKDDQ